MPPPDAQLVPSRILKAVETQLTISGAAAPPGSLVALFPQSNAVCNGTAAVGPTPTDANGTINVTMPTGGVLELCVVTNGSVQAPGGDRVFTPLGPLLEVTDWSPMPPPPRPTTMHTGCCFAALEIDWHARICWAWTRRRRCVCSLLEQRSEHF